MYRVIHKAWSGYSKSVIQNQIFKHIYYFQMLKICLCYFFFFLELEMYQNYNSNE